MIRIKYHCQNGFKITKGVEGFYPKPKEGKETEFDVQQANHSQMASQITSYVGLLDNVKRLIKSSQTLFRDTLGEVNALSDRIELCNESTNWCEQEMDTIIKASKSGYNFQTNFQKEEKLKFETEHGLFTSESIPPGYLAQLELCEEIPPLDMLDNDPLNEEGQMLSIQSYKQNYSDPFGIYKQWLESQQRKAQRKAQARKDKKKKKKKQEAAKLQKKVAGVKLKRLQYSFVGQGVGSGDSKKAPKEKKKKMKIQVKKTQKVHQKQKSVSGGAPPPPSMDNFDEPQQKKFDEDSDDDDVPDAPDAPDIDNLNLSLGEGGGGGSTSTTKAGQMKAQRKQEGVGDIFAQIRSGGFNLKKVDSRELAPKPASERDNLLSSIRRFDKTVLKKSTERELQKPKLKNTRAPMNVGEILQRQLAMISQSGVDDDDDLSDDDWDDDDDDEW